MPARNQSQGRAKPFSKLCRTRSFHCQTDATSDPQSDIYVHAGSAASGRSILWDSIYIYAQVIGRTWPRDPVANNTESVGDDKATRRM